MRNLKLAARNLKASVGDSGRVAIVTRTIARFGLTGKIVHDDLVWPPSVSAYDHPARTSSGEEAGTQNSPTRRTTGTRRGVIQIATVRRKHTFAARSRCPRESPALRIQSPAPPSRRRGSLHCHGRDCHRRAGLHRRLTGGIHPSPRLKDVPHRRGLDFLRLEASPLDRSADGDGAKNADAFVSELVVHPGGAARGDSDGYLGKERPPLLETARWDRDVDGGHGRRRSGRS